MIAMWYSSSNSPKTKRITKRETQQSSPHMIMRITVPKVVGRYYFALNLGAGNVSPTTGIKSNYSKS